MQPDAARRGAEGRAAAGPTLELRGPSPAAATAPSGKPPPVPSGTPHPRADGARPKRANTSAKGTHVELQAIKILEAEGYKVHRCVRTGMRRGPRWFSQSNDVFGCIDLVAKKRGERTRWIQVTADSGIGRKKADLAQVPWDPLFDSVEIWRWVGGARRRHKRTGEVLERQYFQVYHHDDGFGLHRDRRVHVQGAGGANATG